MFYLLSLNVVVLAFAASADGKQPSSSSPATKKAGGKGDSLNAQMEAVLAKSQVRLVAF